MERFFSLVWRANALVILAAGLGGLVLVGVVFFQLVREFRGPHRVEGVVNIANEELESESFHFGTFEAIPGSSYLTAPLYTEQGYPLGSVSKYSRASRNYLFFDPSKGSAHWLLPNNEGLVEWRRQFPEPRANGDREPAVAVLWEVIDQDSTGDRKLTDSDLSTLYISKPEGRPLVSLVSGVQQILGANQVGSHSLVVMYLEGNSLRAARVDLSSLSLVSNEEVSTLPSAAR